LTWESYGNSTSVRVKFESRGVKLLVLKIARLTRQEEEIILVEFDDVIQYKKWLDLRVAKLRSIDLAKV